LPAEVSRPGGGRSPASRRPQQLDLFGALHPAAEPGRTAPSQKPLKSLEPLGPAPAPPTAFPRLAKLSGALAAREKLRLELFQRLGRLTGGRLRSLALTDNRRTILSVRPPHPSRPVRTLRPTAAAPIDLRIHCSFALASEPVLREVAVFLESPKGSAPARRALAAIREHFNRYRADSVALTAAGALLPARAATRDRRPTDVRGSVLDLAEIAADLNQRYFEGRLKVRITWGKAAGETAHDCRRSRTASLQLGSYSYEDRLIRIHRVLDGTDVPRYVVESVVYHELLHADLPPVTRNGRRYFHTPEFRRRERQFRHFEKADGWVHDNLQSLLRARAAPATRRR
jgi:hypothetical protein